MPPIKDWPHPPVHRIGPDGIYLVTGATPYKEHFFTTAEQLSLLENELLSLAKQHHWLLEAGAVFVNHYHFVARGHPEATPLKEVSPASTFEYCSRLRQDG